MAGQDVSGLATIETPQDLAHGASHLAALSPDWARVIALTDPLPLRRKPAGFATMLSAIVGQQVSTASATAIWARVDCAGLTDEAAMRAATAPQLAACGLSKPKIRYAKSLADARLRWADLGDLHDEAAIAELTAVLGIGRWSAEIYLLSALGRADVFPAGDLALQEAARLAFGLAARPADAGLRALAENWRPFRAVAARALWAYYRVEKQKEGIR